MNDIKKLYLNTFVPLLAQVITLICGFILPRIILTYYGSEINGAISSVSQFLGIINLFDLGVTAVFQSALYSPLTNNDKLLLSETVSAADNFFKVVGRILVLYIGVLCFTVPILVKGAFSYTFWITLILAMGINSFGQYYLGVVDRIILIADQKYYIITIVQIFTFVISTFISIILIYTGASIQIVKFASSIVFLFKPLFYRLYINNRYDINRHVNYRENPLKQKWNGVAQHVCAVVLDGTDIIVLTIFSSLLNVSIYQTYYFVVAAVRTLFLSMTNAVSPLIGKLWAQNNIDAVKRVYRYYEWMVNAITTFVFGCTATLLVPFISIYTMGIDDADYYQPLFAVLLTISVAFYCLRLPYTSLVNATGRYRQTQHIYIIAMLLNIVISILAVKSFGLIGVTLGTLISLGYQTIHMSVYGAKKIIMSDLKNTYVLWIIDAIIFVTSYAICSRICFNVNTYPQWVLLAVFTTLIWFLTSLVFWCTFRRSDVHRLKKEIFVRIHNV